MEDTTKQIEKILEEVKNRDPDQKEFYQAVEEVVTSLQPVFQQSPEYVNVLRKLVEPERVIIFRVPWLDDDGIEQCNRGFRVQFNSAIGPYKGGLRFHPSVNLSILKFLGFEQMFKNALTGLPLGGGKGGSDFNPRGRSDQEVMRFCQSFMTELYRHIGANTDIPAGDIGVGGREIGYLFGQYKRLTSRFEGVLTGKGADWGGSKIRPEATGYGLVYYAENILKSKEENLRGAKCVVSGAGNVAQFAAKKLLSAGAKVVTMSDSNGYIHAPDGLTETQLEKILELKNQKRGRLSEFETDDSFTYHDGKSPWSNVEDIDYAFPCATQNEIDEAGAKALVQHGCKGVFEGANMPSTTEAIRVYTSEKLLFAPAKAANAGGVAVSGLEMSQNSIRMQWSNEEVDDKLQGIMAHIFEISKENAKKYGEEDNLQLGANAAGFEKVAQAMLEQGCV